MVNRFTIYFGWSPCTPSNKNALLQASLKREGTRNSLLSNKNYLNLFTPAELAQLIETHRPQKKSGEADSKYLGRCNKYDTAMAKRLLPHFNTKAKCIKLVEAFSLITPSPLLTTLLKHPSIQAMLLQPSDDKFLQPLLKKQEGLSFFLSSQPWIQRASPYCLALVTSAYYKSHRMDTSEREQILFDATLLDSYQILGDGSITYRLAKACKNTFQYVINAIEPDNSNDLFIKQFALQNEEVVDLCNRYSVDLNMTNAFLDKYFAVMRINSTETPCDIVSQNRYNAESLLRSPVIVNYLKTKKPGITGAFLINLLSFYEDDAPLFNDILFDELLNSNQRDALLTDLFNHITDEPDGFLRYSAALSYLMRKYPYELTKRAISIKEEGLNAPILLKWVTEHHPQLLANIDDNLLITTAVYAASTPWFTSFVDALSRLGKNMLAFAKQSFELAQALMRDRYHTLSNLEKVEIVASYQQSPEQCDSLIAIIKTNSDSLYQFAMQDPGIADLVLSEQGQALIAHEHWTQDVIDVLALRHNLINHSEEEILQALPSIVTDESIPVLDKQAEPKAQECQNMIRDVGDIPIKIVSNPLENLLENLLANRQNRQLLRQLYQKLQPDSSLVIRIAETRYTFKINDIYKQLIEKIFNTGDTQWLLAEMGADIFKVIKTNNIVTVDDINALVSPSQPVANLEKKLGKILLAVIDNPSIAQALLASKEGLEQAICKYVFGVSMPLTDAVLNAFGKKEISKAFAIHDSPQLQDRLLNLAQNNVEIAAELARLTKPLSLILAVFEDNKRASRIRDNMGYQSLTDLSLVILANEDAQKTLKDAAWGFMLKAAANSKQTAEKLLSNTYAQQLITKNQNHIEERFQVLSQATLSSVTDATLIKLKSLLGTKLNEMQRQQQLAQQAQQEQLVDNELRPLIENNNAKEVEQKIKDYSLQKAVSEVVILELMKQQTSPAIIYALAFHSPFIASTTLQQHYFSAVQIAALLLHHVKSLEDPLLYVVNDDRCQRVDFDSQELLQPWSLSSIAEDNEARTLLLQSAVLQQALVNLIKQKAALNPDTTVPSAPYLRMAPPPPPPPSPPPPPPAFKPVVKKPLAIEKPEEIGKPESQMTPAQMIEATKAEREAKKHQELMKIRQKLEASGELDGLTDSQIDEKISAILIANNEAKQRQLREAARTSSVEPVFSLKEGGHHASKVVSGHKPKEPPIIKGIPDVLSSEFTIKIYQGIKPRGDDKCSASDKQSLQDALKSVMEPMYDLNKYTFDLKSAADAELLKNDIEAIVLEVGVSQLWQAMDEVRRSATNSVKICEKIKKLDDGKLLRGANGLVDRFYTAMVNHVALEKNKNRISARKPNAILQQRASVLPDSQEPNDILAQIRQGISLKKNKKTPPNPDNLQPQSRIFSSQREPALIPGLSNTVINFFADEFIKFFSKPIDASGQLAAQQQLEAKLKNDIKAALKGQFDSLPEIVPKIDENKDRQALCEMIHSRLTQLLTNESLVANGFSDKMLQVKSVIYAGAGTNSDTLLTTYAKIFTSSLRAYQQVQADKHLLQETNGNHSSSYVNH